MAQAIWYRLSCLYNSLFIQLLHCGTHNMIVKTISSVAAVSYHGILEVCVHDTWNSYKPTKGTAQLLCEVFVSHFNKRGYKNTLRINKVFNFVFGPYFIDVLAIELIVNSIFKYALFDIFSRGGLSLHFKHCPPRIDFNAPYRREFTSYLIE